MTSGSYDEGNSRLVEGYQRGTLNKVAWERREMAHKFFDRTHELGSEEVELETGVEDERDAECPDERMGSYIHGRRRESESALAGSGTARDAG
jgi:hypothetical protein